MVEGMEVGEDGLVKVGLSFNGVSSVKNFEFTAEDLRAQCYYPSQAKLASPPLPTLPGRNFYGRQKSSLCLH
jgi:hypothetical protein